MLMAENLIDKLVEVSVEIQRDKPDGKRPPSSKLFLHASGDWKVVLHGDSLWVVGHHLAYPARDGDDAQRLLQELSRQHKGSQGKK
jgi:hypothetical protein